MRHGNYYYLFASVDYCCEATAAEDNYKEAVGRSTSPYGPFVDHAGISMLNGGGTVLLEGNAAWNAPGGATAYIDASTGESLLVFSRAEPLPRCNALPVTHAAGLGGRLARRCG